METLEENLSNFQIDVEDPLYEWALKNNIYFLNLDGYLYLPKDELKAQFKNILDKAKHKSYKVILTEPHPPTTQDDPHALLEYNQVYNFLSQISDQLQIKIYYTTENFHNHDSVGSYGWFPYWYYVLKHHANIHKYKNFDFNSRIRNKNFSCNNFQSHKETKIYNYLECHKRDRRDWITSFYITPYQKFGDTRTNITESHDHYNYLTTEQLELWDKIKLDLKEYTYDGVNDEPFNAFMIMFPGHLDSYCNLVVETSIKQPIISEKSFKPFIANQIPIFLGYIDICKFLSSLGFDLFYDFFNHDQYDHLGASEWPLRIIKVHEMLDDLYKQDFTAFFHEQSTKQRLLHNQNLFFSDTISNKVIEHLEKLIQ